MLRQLELQTAVVSLSRSATGRLSPRSGPMTLCSVYKESYGEANTFTFLELAFAEQAITKLDQGLKGRYFVGASCADTKICDFKKATPAELRQTSQYAKYKFFLG